MKEYPFKKMPGMDNIEVEHGETIQLPDGNVYQVNGKTHKRGGENVYAPDNSRVFSQHLKLPSSVSKELGGPERKISPAELSKRYPTEKFRTMLEKSKNDPIKEKTAALMHAKHLTMQDAIFTAQESMKEEKKINKKSFRYGGLKKYQSGNWVDPGLSELSPATGLPQQPGWNLSPWESLAYRMGSNMPGSRTATGISALDSGITPDVLRTMARQSGASVNVPGRGTVTVSNLSGVPGQAGFTPDPYWTNIYGQKTGYLPGNQDLGNWQRRITNLDFGTPEDQNEIKGAYAGYLGTVNQMDPDKFLRHSFSNNPARATTENLRTNTFTRVDYREGNEGERTSNQAYLPIAAEAIRPPEPSVAPVPVTPKPIPTTPTPLPERPKTYDDEPYTFEKEVAQIDPEQYYNALMGGLDLATLASIRRENPYYAINTANPSTTRFDPINTMQNERAFNMARNAVLNSNLPDSVKQSQLAQLQANMAEGVNQVDITNYQGNLANQNANIQRVDAARDFNAQNRNAANLNYLQSLGAARNMVDRQRQELIDRMTDRWRSRLQNQMNIQLLNQMVPNYAFNPEGGVQYKPGSTTTDFDILDAYNILRTAAQATQQKTT